MCELVLSCVMPYIKDNDDLNSVSLVSNKFFDIDSKTRKHLIVHVPFAPDPKRVSLRFPNLESLTLKSYSYGRYDAKKCSFPVTPWIQEIAVSFKFLKSLSIRNMVVSDSDLKLLAKTRGGSLRSLEIRGCKMFSEDGLEDIARCCIELRSLRLRNYYIANAYEGDYMTKNGKWFHELALCNTVMESLEFACSFVPYDMEDVTLLVKKCSHSLVSLNPYSFVPYNLSDFRQVFELAKKLEHVAFHLDEDYSGFRFPPNIRGLRILDLTKDSFPFLLPYLAQLRELELICTNFTSANCQCYFFERCPSLEILHTWDICGDEGSIVIGQFCKKLRKLTHHERLTEKGLIAVAQGCPNLEYLNVQFSDISNKALECVGTCLKNLRVFRIYLYPEGGLEDFPLDNGVRAMLMGCKKLERLDIHIHLSPGVLTDVGLGYIGEYGHNLRHLSLSNTGESDVGLLELLKGCPKLRKLKLNRCPFSKQAIASFVFSINQSIRYVWLDYNARDFDVSVLTRPMVSGQVLTELYLKLAGILHRLALQLVADVSQLDVHPSGVGSVKITYTSSRVTDDIDTPLIRNMVSNSIWNVEQETLGRTSEKTEIIVRIANVESRFNGAVSEFGDIKFQGRVKDGVPHLTKVGAFEVDVSLDGHILLCRQVDEPNMIGSVASILGKENVNISSMSVYRAAPGKQALMVIVVDEKPSEEALKKIDEIPAVEEFVFLAL